MSVHQSSAAEMAWLVLHLARRNALAAAKAGRGRAFHVAKVAGLGSLEVTCWREEVQRKRGPKMRARFVYALNGRPIKEKDLYAAQRALRDDGGMDGYFSDAHPGDHNNPKAAMKFNPGAQS